MSSLSKAPCSNWLDEVVASVPVAPYYRDDAVVIFNADCKEIVPQMPKACLLLTDPPYGLGERWQGGTWGAAPMYADARRWDVRPEDGILLSMIQQASAGIVWGGNYFTLPPSRGFLLWVKVPAMDTMADAEYAWTNLDRPAKAFSGHRNPDGKRDHPTQKPLALMRWCLETVPTAQTVLDPFAGSGTTGRAAKDLGRKAVLVEINERYCEIAARRMGQEVLCFDNFNPTVDPRPTGKGEKQ